MTPPVASVPQPQAGTTQPAAGSAAAPERVQEQAPPVAESRAPEVPASPEMVPISRLTRVNYVAPEYPRAAQRRNITGAVNLLFTVTTDGRVRDVSIASSQPGDTFDGAAIAAVEQWRFEPVVENGVAVEKRTGVRLSFDLQD